MGQTGQLPRFACPDGLLRNPPCACQVKTIINMILKTKTKNKPRQKQHWLKKIP